MGCRQMLSCSFRHACLIFYIVFQTLSVTGEPFTFYLSQTRCLHMKSHSCLWKLRNPHTNFNILLNHLKRKTSWKVCHSKQIKILIYVYEIATLRHTITFPKRDACRRVLRELNARDIGHGLSKLSWAVVTTFHHAHSFVFLRWIIKKIISLITSFYTFLNAIQSSTNILPIFYLYK